MIAKISNQLALFEPDWPVFNADSEGKRRYAYGHAAEFLVRMLLNMEPIPIDGRCEVNYDGVLDGVHVEVKSTHAVDGKLVLYDFRMRKEIKADPRLRYIIFGHRIHKESNDIVRRMLENEIDILVIPALVVHREAYKCVKNKPPVPAHATAGYHREGYSEGYRNLPIKSLWSLPFESSFVTHSLGDNLIRLHRYIKKTP